MAHLIRYWFEFKNTDDPISLILTLGCGVTAFTYSDALSILEQTVFKHTKMPEIINCIENIDIRNLDQGHVVPNMWTPSFRGVWYPQCYHDN